MKWFTLPVSSDLNIALKDCFTQKHISAVLILLFSTTFICSGDFPAKNAIFTYGVLCREIREGGSNNDMFLCSCTWNM